MSDEIKSEDYNKVLIVEDDLIVALDLSLVVKEMGCHVVGIAKNYCDALDVMTHNPANILLCDINLQTDKSGIDVVKDICLDYNLSVIYLSASVDISTVKVAVDTNPCGYLVKPYRYAELFALLQLAMRQSKHSDDVDVAQILELGNGYQFSKKNRILIKDGSEIHLTAKERTLLSYLASHQHEVVCFEELEHHIWPNNPISDSNRRTLIYRLHTKLDAIIITVIQAHGCYLSAFAPKTA
ncbi:MAG: response regulator [Sulfuricurvum sp.]|nr:response regulator [Sulfuricurvum sp.]